MKNFKKYISAIITTVLYAIIGIFFVTGDRLTNSTLYTFIILTLLMPLAFTLIEGMITGCTNKSFKNNMFNILISTVLLSISVIGLTYFITSTGAISIMENNTVASNNISLSINSSVTAGSFIQIIILITVLMKVYANILKSVKETLETISSFVYMLIPMFMSLSISTRQYYIINRNTINNINFNQYNNSIHKSNFNSSSDNSNCIRHNF